MKKFQIILLIINVISFAFILQIKFEFFPLFDSSLKTVTISNLNELIVNASIGILISSLFYIVVVQYPEKLKKKSTLEIIQPRLDAIGNSIQISISYLISKRINNTYNNNDLGLEDFKEITRFDNRSMDLKFKIRSVNKIDWIDFSYEETIEIDHFYSERNTVTSKIDEILDIPTIIYLDDELIRILTQLRDSYFYTGVNSYHLRGDKTTVNGFSEGVFKYHLLYNQLKKYVNLTEFEIIE